MYDGKIIETIIYYKEYLIHKTTSFALLEGESSCSLWQMGHRKSFMG